MTIYRKLFFLILILVHVFALSGTAQDSQDAFSTELLAACQEKNVPKVKELIIEHRLWVKPVVNQLLSDYIDLTMTGNKTAAASQKDAAKLIAQTFQETYGERSLTTGVEYLDAWSLEELGKKAQADRIYGIATELRIGGQQMDKATTKFLQSLEIYQDIGDVRGQGEVLGGLGYIYWFSDIDTCLNYYYKALKARMEADDRVLIGATLNSIGGTYLQHLQQPDSAKAYLKRATEVRQEIGDLAGLGSSMFNLARAYDELGELESALHSYQKSFDILQEFGRKDRMAFSKLGSGTILRNLGRYPEALQDLETARDLFQELTNNTYLADSYTQLALVYDNIGDYTTGIELVTIATGLYQQIDDQWGLAGAYNHTGIILQDAGRKQRAEEFYQKALEIYMQLDDQVNVISVLNNLGTVKLELNDFKGAESYNRQGLELSRKLEYKSGELPCLINLANAQNRLYQLDTAMFNYELALKLCREMKQPDSEWRILVGMAENCKLRGDYPSAIDFNEKGLSIIEDLRSSFLSASEKSNYLARERYAFEDVIHMLAVQHEKDPAKGYDLLAFEYAQRCKSRSFLEQIKGTEPVTLKEVQSAGLKSDRVLLEYSLGDSSSVLWVITPDAFQMIRLPDRGTLEERIESLRFALVNPDQDNKNFLLQSGYYLYKQLIEPAEAFLTRKSQITVLPDGILHYIPFEVLITREPKEGEDRPYEKLAYLGNKHALSYGQSSSVYLSMLAGPASTVRDMELKELVAFGDPLYAGHYKKLEYSGEEVQSIAALFPEGSVDLYLREDASKEKALQKGLLPAYRYIHYATHGVVNETNPGRSGLVLSQGNNKPEDGILSADEISGMKLNAELVVLSACQTGLGKMVRGEGMIGLSRSFMYAGAPAVVVSLWSVSDKSTNLLMTRFYAYLIIHKLTKADALQQARNYMIKETSYAHPFFWAPFVLTGDWH